MVATQRIPDPSLRRAAILLSNLDADNRRRLLAHLPPQDAARVRAAAAALTDVDPLEVRRTVSAFVGHVSAAQDSPQTAALPTGHPSSDASLAGPSPAAAANPNRAASGAAADADSGGGLKFLNAVSDATLLRAIGAEHPQTIAVVLASLDPHQAARLLRQLAPQPRGEAIRRLSRLEEVPQDVIDDIGRHLRGLIGTVDQVGSGEGHRLLTSIFSALDAEDRKTLGAGLVDSDPGIAAALAEAAKTAPPNPPLSALTPPASAPPNAAGRPETADAHPTNANATEAAQPHGEQPHGEQPHGEQPHGEQPHGEQAFEKHSHADSGAGESDASAPRILPLGSQLSARSPALPGVAEADRLLESLPAEQLRQTLAELSARDALLTLCGLSPRCVRRLLRTMPRRSAKEVRQRLNAIGPLELSEIDQAKQRAAAVALGPVPAAAKAA